MKKVIVIMFVIIFSFLYVLDLQAFQFEQYKWGESYAFILSQLKSERIELIEVSEEKLAYKDDIFGRTCDVNLFFISKTQKLAYIQVVWAGEGDTIRDLLIKKYGKANKEKGFFDKYVWGSDKSDQKIVLDYISSGEVKLTYYGGKYYSKYQKALMQTHSKDLSQI